MKLSQNPECYRLWSRVMVKDFGQMVMEIQNNNGYMVPIALVKWYRLKIIVKGCGHIFWSNGDILWSNSKDKSFF